MIPKRSLLLLLAAALLAAFMLMATMLTACRQTSANLADPTATVASAPLATATPQDALAQSLADWRAAVEANPDDPAAHYQLGLLTFLLDPEQAAAPLHQAEQLDPDLATQVSRLEAALRQITIVDDPAYQHTVIGQSLASVEEWSLAETALEWAVTENPQYAEAWAYLGEVRQQTGNGDPLEALNTALDLNPDSYAANLFASMYWKRSEQPETALAYLKNAVAQDAGNLSLQEDLAHTLVLAGEVEEGFQTIQTLLEADPESVEIWLMLARLSIGNGVQVSEVGLPAARQARVLEPENAEATLLLGRAYMLDDDPLMAERFFLLAAEQAPEDAAPHLYLGLLYLNQEKSQSAQAQLQQARSLAQASGEDAIAAQADQILEQYYP